jgi:5-methylcytosine-specific restriction enzyme B
MTSDTKVNSLAFFSKADFVNLNAFVKQKKDKDNKEHTKVYNELVEAYKKTEYWAKVVQEKCFPNGYVKVVKKPTNQASKFEYYLWAKIYPTYASSPELAFVVGINNDNTFDIKIDTVGLPDNDELRKKYFQYRDDKTKKDILLSFKADEILNKDWDNLISLTNEKFLDLIPSYKELEDLLGFGFGNPIINKPTLTNSLNTILYGPPGTGKTYNTINKALNIIGFDTSSKSRQEIKDAFDKYVKDGQIVFTTFHQSMSYEDFIEGIKPETKDDKVLYKVKDGIFKTIANKAFGSFIANDNNKENYTSPTFDQLHSEFLESIKPFEGKEEYIFKTIYNHDIKLIEVNATTIVVMFRWQDVKKSTPAIQRFAVTKDKLKLLFEGGINPHTVKSLKKEFAPYMQHNLSVFYAVYKKFYEFIESKTESKSIEEVEIYDDYSFEEIFEDWQLQNTGEKEEAIQTAKKYVLIIDEINRGNVSQIFGELITLIEDDKRIGCKEQLLITLPYSKSQFGVPSNLYIIGTMNTADRSVEALDTALRRRFVFEEMMPIPEFLAPERMIWQLWWDYAKVDWDEEPYKTKADGLYKLLGIESDFDPKEELWQRMKKERKNENQIAYFDRVEFTGINLQDLLETINKRIEVLLSRDNLIGHSYFISVTSVAELKTAFQNKIIPLLQEYFFGDYGKIGLVLGSEFVEIIEDETAEDLFADFEYDGIENFAEKTVYRLIDINNFSDEEFMNIVNSIF